MEFRTLNGNTLILFSDTTTHREKIQVDDERDIPVFHVKNRIKMLSLNLHQTNFDFDLKLLNKNKIVNGYNSLMS